MAIVLYSLTFIIVILVLLFNAKIYFLKKAMIEIEVKFKAITDNDTNILIDVSSNDKDIKRLVNSINFQLRMLRKQKQKFYQGDYDLKKTMTNASHDIRTPLTAISGYLELLEQEEKTEASAKYIEIMKERIDTLKHISEELFIYSITNSNKDKLIKENVIINSVLEESIADFYTMLVENNITPEIHIPESSVVRLLDRSALVRIFSNLISNAIKYSDGDLKIVLLESGEIIFSNNASGLNNVQVGQLFDRFYTVSVAKKSTGIGLSISKALVDKMGGNIMAKYIDSRLYIHVFFDNV